MTSPTDESAVDGSRPSAADHTRGTIDRRDFVKTALLVGGSSALSSLGSIGIVPRVGSASETAVSVAERDNRQHAWDDYEAVAPTDNTVQPPNGLFLDMDYAGEGTPTGEERATVEAALDRLEEAFEWSTEGLLFTVAYSSNYFDRFDEDPPDGAAPTPAAEVAALAEQITVDDEVPADDSEVQLLLASDNAANVLAAEEALFEGGTVNGVAFEGGFADVFTRPMAWPERRVGFAGPALPTDRYNEEVSDGSWEVPEEAPLSMGFVAGFDSSIPEEPDVSLREGQRFPGPGIDEESVPTEKPYVGEVGERDPGAFAQGTLKHYSYIEIDLDEWYTTNSLEERRHRIYSPYHTDEETGEVGKGITTDPGGDPGAEQEIADDDVPDLPARDADTLDYAELAQQTAEEGTELTDDEPWVGHSQKAARARYDLDGDGDLEQPVLRRDWDALVPTGGDYGPQPGYHFNVPMRYNESIFTLLEANYQLEFQSLDGRIDHEDVDTDWAEKNGIANFMSAAFRTNYLVPPITLRALPPARATRSDALEVTSDPSGGTVVARIDPDGDLDPSDLDFEGGVCRIGTPAAVNRGGGATIDAEDVVETGSGTVIVRADAADTDLSTGDSCRLFAKTTPEAGREPVVLEGAVASDDDGEEGDAPAGDRGRGDRAGGRGGGRGGR